MTIPMPGAQCPDAITAKTALPLRCILYEAASFARYRLYTPRVGSKNSRPSSTHGTNGTGSGKYFGYQTLTAPGRPFEDKQSHCNCQDYITLIQ